MSFICQNITCSIAIIKANIPDAGNCPVCKQPLVELKETPLLSDEDEKLIASLPYVIAYPLKETLLQNDYEKRLHRLGYTFINFLKYLGLISISEFFNSDFKNRKIVDLFLSQLREPSFGKWNGFIRDCYATLEKEKIKLVFPEFYDFYGQIENKDKKFNISEEIIEDFGEVNYSKKNGLSSIGMLIYFRNKYLGHGTPINENKAKELWEFHYPIFQTLLIKLQNLSQFSLYKKENGIVWKLASSVVTEENNLNQTIDDDKVWLADNKGRKLSMVPFFIIPSDCGALKNDAQLLVYESYTGSTIKFFSPESIVMETSGKILERLNLLLREKQKETPFTPEAFTKDEFLKRIAEENKLLLDTLISEKKIIPGVYQHREEIEIKLREWIGARASIFFIVAEAGSGKTNLIVEIQKQYAERELPSLLIRAGRMEKQSLKQQINYLLNIDFEKGLENYSSIAGTQSEPTFILIDGLNEANNAEEIWQEIIDLSKVFEPGSLKFVLTNRANTKAELNRYLVSEKDQDLLFGENNDNETGLGAYSFWLTALDMKEMKSAWENYATKDKAKFKPQFNFDAIAEFDRGLYNQINNPLILRLFLEIYNGKALPKKGVKHLNIWHDWVKLFSDSEQTFLKLVANEVWQKGKNELLLDELLKNEILKSYFTSDIINAPYKLLKSNGWISSYVKDLNGYVGFTVEGALLYILALQLQEQKPGIDLAAMQSLFKSGSKLQKSAIEAFLCEQALNGDLNLVADLIDAGNYHINLSTKPLLLYLKTFGAEATINKVLENPSENDWKALKKLDAQLKQLQLHILRNAFLKALMPKNELKTKEAVGICFNAIVIFDKNDAIYYFKKVDTNASIIIEDPSLLSQIGKFEKKFGNYDKALDYYEKSLAIKLKTLDEMHPRMAVSYNEIGILWKTKGNYDKALEYYQKCLAIRLKTSLGESSSVAFSYGNIGQVWIIKGDFNKALEYYEKSLEIKIKLFGGEHPSVANSYNQIGLIWKKKGDLEKALLYNEKSLAIKIKTMGEEHPDVATSYNNIGMIWNSKGDFEKALEYYQKCLAIKLDTLGEEHPDVATSYNNKGTILLDSKGDHDKALEYYQKSLAIRLDTLGGEHPDVATSYNNIGMVWNRKGDYEKALEYHEKSLAIRLKTLGGVHPDVAISYNNIGLTWKNKGDYDKALEFYTKCLAIRLNTLGPEHPDVADSYNNIGNCNYELKFYLLAIDFFKKGFSTLKKGGFPFQIGKCYEALDNKKLALDFFIQSAEIRRNDPEVGMEDESTKTSIENTKRLAKELGKENELPDWINNYNSSRKSE